MSWRPTWRRGRKRVRIGMAVSLAAFYNPLRLAEEVAMIDVLSGGRVNWGAGRGFDRSEFEAFGVPVEESSDRFRECVEIVLASWRQERMSYQGRFWKYDGVEVLPKPLQSPHPPVWLAATSPDSIRRAGEGGYDILQDPHATHAEIGVKRELYYQVLREHGFLSRAASFRPHGSSPSGPPIRRRMTWRGRARPGPCRPTRIRASARARPPPITWSPTRSRVT